MLLPLRLKMCMLRPLRPKSGMLRPLRLKMVMLRLCATDETLCEFARQICCNFVRPKMYVATIATQNGYVATLCDRNICATLRDFARPKTDMFRLCAAQKRYAVTIATQNRYFATSWVEVCDLFFNRLD